MTLTQYGIQMKDDNWFRHYAFYLFCENLICILLILYHFYTRTYAVHLTPIVYSERLSIATLLCNTIELE